MRAGAVSQDLTPVYLGSAYKNKGVQLLLRAVTRYLPSPPENHNMAVDLKDDESEVEVFTDPAKPLVLLAFKLEDGRYGQLTYVRVYQGTLKKGDTIYNMRTGKKVKVGRLIRMHSDEMQDIDGTSAGDIVALFGVEHLLVVEIGKRTAGRRAVRIDRQDGLVGGGGSVEEPGHRFSSGGELFEQLPEFLFFFLGIVILDVRSQFRLAVDERRLVVGRGL